MGKRKSRRRRKKKSGSSGSGQDEWRGKKTIAVEKYLRGGKTSEVCVFNLEEGKEIKVGGELLNHKSAYGFGLAGVGPVLYAIAIDDGADDDDDDEYMSRPRNDGGGVACIDLSLTPTEWKPFVPQVVDDGKPEPTYCVALGDKIFSFGGRSPLSCYGQFYDTAADAPKKWHPIPLPPISPKVRLPILSDPDNDRLIFFSPIDRSLLAYYPSRLDSPWDILAADDTAWLSWCHRSASSPVDNVIYVYSRDEGITAYYITTRKQLDVSWTTQTPFNVDALYLFEPLKILYLGDNIICFISLSRFLDPSPQDYTLNLVFFRFQVCRISEKEATITPLSRHTIPALGTFRPYNYVAF